jgi:hypothetical protein
MHLEGPWLSTTGKQKTKRKFRNAEQARKSRELQESWQDLLKKYEVPKSTKKTKLDTLVSTKYNLRIPEGRNTTAHIKSLDSGLGNATLAPAKVYTGTKVKGIATMHKSNAVPVFSDDEAIEISRMRRG